MADALRILAVDAIGGGQVRPPRRAHGMAEMVEGPWHRHLKHNPAHPHWPDRDRFVLSNGHGSMLIYALLHLTGYDLPMSELRSFRQLHSKTPPPRVGVTPGWRPPPARLARATNAVGWRWPEPLAAEFNRSADGGPFASSTTSPTSSWATAA